MEGADQPFVVWTDHKTLDYIRTANRLNFCQARWAVFFFFNRLNFALSYHPGSKNVKPEGLSCLFQSEDTSAQSVEILPTTCIIGAVSWGT